MGNFSFSDILDIFAAITVVAMVYVVVSNGEGTGAVITAWGNAYSSSIRAATGK